MNTLLLKDKQQIIDWLNTYRVKNYTLVADDIFGFIVNVDGTVDLRNKKLEFIAVKFGHVTLNFNCSSNTLTSLC